MIPAEAVEAAAKAMAVHGLKYERYLEDARTILEAAAPHIRAASAAKLRGWYDERMSDQPAPDVTLADYEQGRGVGTTEGILAAALLIEAEVNGVDTRIEAAG